MILTMDSPKGKTVQTELTVRTNEDYDNGFSKGETPQTERTLQKSEDPEHGTPQRGRQKNSLKNQRKFNKIV